MLEIERLTTRMREGGGHIEGVSESDGEREMGKGETERKRKREQKESKRERERERWGLRGRNM